AGKTTALGVCHGIWKAGGYAIYGLTPTGKAAQNLEQGGIPSTTLHKFLKSFEEGRCQYNEKSVLVLDEAGMVDMERFEKLLGAVQQLGVKLIVVGDGAQLQPVEAGPAFRLVTTRLGKAELNTVLRQKEEWQKEATVLFGQQKTEDAIQAYAERGYIHIVDEKLPSLVNAKEAVKLYEISHRVPSLVYREMIRDVQKEHPEALDLYPLIQNHQDFAKYVHWKGIEKQAAQFILKDADGCRPIVEERCLDPLKIALTVVDKTQPKNAQRGEATELLKECKLDHLIGIQRPVGMGVEVRAQAKEELIQAWHHSFKAEPGKTALMLAYSNRDVNDLNQSARTLLKASGHISGNEVTYTIKREVEDDFGRTHVLKTQKGFAKGDRIVFTKNKYWLGVRNGSMGTITNINSQKIHVKLDEGKELSFAPNLNPHFDYGWAVTIHKSQGTTVDRTFVLASFEMTQNLAYVAMTRHREGVKVFGSSFDFWRPEKLPQVLSKSGEKLSAADYLDTESLSQLMKADDFLITKIFNRMSNELEAMGAVTKQAFKNVADHFLGKTREKEIRVLPEGMREEVRAEELFHQKRTRESVSHLHHEHFHLDFYDAGEKENLQAANEVAMKDPLIQKELQKQAAEISFSSNQKGEKKPDKKTLWQTIKSSFKGSGVEVGSSHNRLSASIFSERSNLSLSPTPTAVEKEIYQQPKNIQDHYMTAEFKKEILGDSLYQKITTKNQSHKSPQVVSEELKRDMVGEKFYNKDYKTKRLLTTEERNKLSRIYTLSHIEEDHAHHEQDISLSQKPTSRGRKR
ncbi:MAG: AAA family ATPase, partial [Alphaproteobacteria bacterium]|nr:AAA family ATPase [Alphaproteobacteria bacterium]